MMDIGALQYGGWDVGALQYMGSGSEITPITCSGIIGITLSSIIVGNSVITIPEFIGSGSININIGSSVNSTILSSVPEFDCSGNINLTISSLVSSSLNLGGITNVSIELEPLILNLIVKQIGRNDVYIDLDRIDLNLILNSNILVKIKSEFATFLNQKDPRDIRAHVDLYKTNILYQNVSGEKSKDWNFGVW